MLAVGTPIHCLPGTPFHCLPGTPFHCLLGAVHVVKCLLLFKDGTDSLVNKITIYFWS